MGKNLIRNLSVVFLTSVVASSAVFAKADAVAQTPTLKINGYTIVTAAFANQNDKSNGLGGQPSHLSIGASDLYFTITVKNAMYRINIETVPGSGMYINRNYIQFEGDFGTLQLGNTKGPESSMPESGVNLVGGAGGVDGTFTGVYNNSAGVISAVTFIGDTNKATKVAFYSPTVKGWQLGLSFTPNTSHMGKESRNSSVPGIKPRFGNSEAIYPDKDYQPYGIGNIVTGVTYKGIQDKWSWTGAAVMVFEKTRLVMKARDDADRNNPVHNARSYQLTGAVGYDKWRFAAGFIDNGKSRLPKSKIDALTEKVAVTAADGTVTPNVDKVVSGTDKSTNLGDTHKGNAGKSWNVGGSYTVGAYQFAAAYHHTDRKTDATNKATSDILVTTVDFNALPGLKFFGELDFVSTKTNDAAKKVQQTAITDKGVNAIGNNAGSVLILGTKLSF